MDEYEYLINTETVLMTVEILQWLIKNNLDTSPKSIHLVAQIRNEFEIWDIRYLNKEVYEDFICGRRTF